MNPGTKVKITRTSNKHAKHFVGKTGIVVGPNGPLGMIVIKLEDGIEYWVDRFNLTIISK